MPLPSIPSPVPGMGKMPNDFDLKRLTAHIHDICGIQIPPSKRNLLEGRLRKRMETLGLDGLEDYCRWVLTDDHLVTETDLLINAVTTNKTDFFREPAHFDYLTSTVLPEMTTGRQRPLRIWSSACSTGAEPYTLAMVVDAFLKQHGGPDYGILATDIDTQVLEVARQGIYSRDLIRPVPEALRNRYVMNAIGQDSAKVRIVPELRSAIGFAQLNLIDNHYPVGDPMDVIFCRNVLIYFNKHTQVRVVSQLVDKLRPGGFIMLGHTESAAGTDPRLRYVANTIFRKV